MKGRWPVLMVALVGALIEFGLLHLWVHGAYVNFSDGVYAESAREWVHGLMPYRDWAGAQPPPIFMIGAGLLELGDNARPLRLGMSALDLLCAALVARCVFRLDGRLWLALGTGAVSALLPTTLLNQSQLLPETLAAPLILAGALWCSDERTDWLGVLVLALAAWCKLAFLAPALAVALSSPRRWRNSAGVLGVVAIAMGASVAIFGTAMWRETVTAQFGLPHPSIGAFFGILAQEAWNDLPVAGGALLFAWGLSANRKRIGDYPLALTLLGASAGGMALALSVDKLGSYGYVLAVAEGPALALGVCAVNWGWRHFGTAARAVIVAVVLLLCAQTASIFADPVSPAVAVRPGAANGPGWVADSGQVAALVKAAQACPVTDAYSGRPEIAFLAGRRMPANQPDEFMLGNARQDAAFSAAYLADNPKCP